MNDTRMSGNCREENVEDNQCIFDWTKSSAVRKTVSFQINPHK